MANKRYRVKIPNHTEHTVIAANKRAATKAVRQHLNLKKVPSHTEIIPVKKERLTIGQKTADLVTSAMGSWKFILIQSGILFLWILFNVIYFNPWDPYPFILMNLLLSFIAAYAAPIIMMSHNRREKKDRETLIQGFNVNKQGLVIDQQTNENVGEIYQILLELLQKTDKHNILLNKKRVKNTATRKKKK